MPSSVTSIGLYFPFIHFRDENWLKVAALYWDRMGRIVPHQYDTHDSDTVRRLQAELGFIVDFDPHRAVEPVGAAFLDLLRDHEAELAARYTLHDTPLRADPGVAWLFSSKIAWQLVHEFQRVGLAVAGRPYGGRGPDWVGMHTKLLSVYMTALAESLAKQYGLHPVTDRPEAQLAVTGMAMDRLAELLLDDAELTPQEMSENEIEARLATLALSVVLPRDLDRVSVEQIIEVRRRYAGEFAAFQTYLHTFAARLSQWHLTDGDAVQRHVEIECHDHLLPHLREIEHCMHAVRIETVISALLAICLTSPGVAVGHLQHSTLIETGAVVLGLIPVIREQMQRRQDAHRASAHAAYLLRVEHAMQPSALWNEVSRHAHLHLPAGPLPRV